MAAWHMIKKALVIKQGSLESAKGPSTLAADRNPASYNFQRTLLRARLARLAHSLADLCGLAANKAPRARSLGTLERAKPAQICYQAHQILVDGHLKMTNRLDDDAPGACESMIAAIGQVLVIWRANRTAFEEDGYNSLRRYEIVARRLGRTERCLELLRTRPDPNAARVLRHADRAEHVVWLTLGQLAKVSEERLFLERVDQALRQADLKEDITSPPRFLVDRLDAVWALLLEAHLALQSTGSAGRPGSMPLDKRLSAACEEIGLHLGTGSSASRSPSEARRRIDRTRHEKTPIGQEERNLVSAFPRLRDALQSAHKEVETGLEMLDRAEPVHAPGPTPAQARYRAVNAVHDALAAAGLLVEQTSPETITRQSDHNRSYPIERLTGYERLIAYLRLCPVETKTAENASALVEFIYNAHASRKNSH